MRESSFLAGLALASRIAKASRLIIGPHYFKNRKELWNRNHREVAMDTTYAQLAAAITGFLAPYAPYLVEGGRRFAVAGKAGEATWSKAQEIWNTIKSHFADDLKIKGAALALSVDTEDEYCRIFLAKVLAEQLYGNPDIARKLFDLLGGRDELQEVLADQSGWVDEV
jgi:hypothetical protein